MTREKLRGVLPCKDETRTRRVSSKQDGRRMRSCFRPLAWYLTWSSVQAKLQMRCCRRTKQTIRSICRARQVDATLALTCSTPSYKSWESNVCKEKGIGLTGKRQEEVGSGCPATRHARTDLHHGSTSHLPGASA